MLALVCALTLAAGAPRAQETFSSDTWIPADNTAGAALVAGDAEARLALEGGRGAELAWGKAFESWSRALRESEPGAVVPTGARDGLGLPVAELAELWPDLDGTFQRRHESIEYALLRRISGLPEAARDSWREQQEPLAEAALRAASPEPGVRARDLAAIERGFPATRTAARAALARFDLAFEEGRTRVARSWLERSARHARLAQAADLETALEVRRSALPTAPLRQPAGWESASELKPTAQHTLVLPNYTKPRAFARIDGPAGVTRLDGERLVVQTSDRVWVFTPRSEDRAFEPWLVASELGSASPRNADRPGRDWPLLPTSDGEHLYIVASRADGVTSNFVQRLRPPRDLDLPEVLWSLGGDGLYGPEGLRAPLEEVLGPGLFEFQPGPVLAGDLLLVQARQWTQTERDGLRQVNSPGEARAWLIALETSSGRPRWMRQVCRGTDVLTDLGARFGRGELIRTPAEPLTLLDQRVFVGTNLGACALYDLADGRLVWSLFTRRRSPERPGWQASGPAPVDWQEPGAPRLLWAPSDAHELCVLRAGLDFDPGVGPLLARPPLPIGEAERLVGGDADLALVYGRAGARRTLSAHELSTARRYDSVFLGQEERFLGRALVTPEQVLCSTDRGLYRFDRRRELYLESVQALTLEPEWAAGGLWDLGARVVLLASGGMFVFAAR